MSSAPVGHNGGPEFYTDCGWVAIARAMRKHSLVGFHLHANPMDANRGAMQPALAWIDLIMECRYAPGEVSNNGKKMQLQRGQLVGATSWLADRWNWTPKSVRNWLEKLEKAGMISFGSPEDSKGELKGRLEGTSEGRSEGRSKGRFANIITLCNYDEYQLPQRAQGQVRGQVQGQVQGQVGGSEKGRLDAIYPRARETSKQDNKQTIEPESQKSSTVAAASSGLAAPRDIVSIMVPDVRAWMSGGAEDIHARNWIQTTSAGTTNGGQILYDAYIKLKTDLATGSASAQPLKTLVSIFNRLKAEAARKPTSGSLSEAEQERRNRLILGDEGMRRVKAAQAAKEGTNAS